MKRFWFRLRFTVFMCNRFGYADGKLKFSWRVSRHWYGYEGLKPSQAVWRETDGWYQ